ncbi:MULTISPECIES: CBS domain-containing protein [unclassified Streptomyces]|uniref:CBS domain-containing protein n=1 Tax=unclassified Streptomyces TaxID=2593676 RepID=UPI002DD92D4D|nr:CBS domain-containing protein [Streptomyces sp. NBC_01750]WSB04420.1 CBS domain-containing protein [Streptomyces sp. NBC_01794]WSD31299.1 CBS domain-containing protein [Streptomyces sp. NBC_01750]
MNEREGPVSGADARRVVGEGSRADEPREQHTLLRHLGAVATAFARQAAARHPVARSPLPPHRTGAQQVPPASDTEAIPLLVRDVMDVSAASVRGDASLLAIARALTDAGVGSLPVTATDGRVKGVVSESDLLAKAAVEASGHEPGARGALVRRRLHDSARAQTAEDLMTAPAITVHPEATVAEAAWLASLSRLKRLPVSDKEGHLVGVVRRNVLLSALVRDDAGIQEEIESKILAKDFPSAQETVTVTVRNGAVDVRGQMARGDAQRLLTRIGGLADVTEVVDHLTAV